MKYCRIDLSKTNYPTIPYGHWTSIVERDNRISQLNEIYKKYCIYKKFESVMPLFESVIMNKCTDVFTYFPDNKLSAFSIVKKHDRTNAESLQFAWDYSDPSLRLGIESLKHECAYYKSFGFEYLYLGETADYKSELDGYEILGPISV
jgi:hypothetical protein